MKVAPFVILVGVLLVGCVGGLAWLVHDAARHPWTTTESSCEEWLRAPAAGRVVLRDCGTTITPTSSGAALVSIHNGDRRAVVLWESTDAEVVGLSRHLARPVEGDVVRRFRERYRERVSATRDVAGVATLPFLEDGPIVIRQAPRELPPMGAAFFLLFGFPLALLLRAQRRWRRIERTWERSLGVVVEASADEPATF